MITYPVSPDSRWAILRISDGEIVARNKPWPTKSGGPIPGLEDDYVFLLQVATPQPAYNAATQKVVALPDAIDVDANTLTQAWEVVALDATELAALAAAAARQTEINAAKAAYTALMNGTGTQAERLVRCERVLARVIRETFSE